jgi:hypothetical protein
VKTYARVQNGIVFEIIEPMIYDADSPPDVTSEWSKGDEIAITERYNSQLIDGPVSTMVDITNTSPTPGQGWTYDGSAFAAQS